MPFGEEYWCQQEWQPCHGDWPTEGTPSYSSVHGGTKQITVFNLSSFKWIAKAMPSSEPSC